MDILFIVNHSPWGSTLAAGAARLAACACEQGNRVRAVFFRGDGVYNALDGAASDAGAVQLRQAWSDMAGDHGVALLLCQSSVQRRLPELPAGRESGLEPFRPAGLAELVDLALECDRVVTF